MEMSSTATSSAPAASSAMSTSTSTSTSMGSSSQCQLPMLWNWNTIDACFLSSTWRITSHGMFAGSCIGIIFLVLSLEFLRRLGKEYDRFLARRYGQRKTSQVRNTDASEEPPNDRSSEEDPKQNPRHHIRAALSDRVEEHSAGSWKDRLVSRSKKPNVKQQLVRALLHMLQFGVAYIIMLLAMSYNGYVIFCILIGAFLGAFIFSWDTIGTEQTPHEDPTVCFG